MKRFGAPHVAITSHNVYRGDHRQQRTITDVHEDSAPHKHMAKCSQLELGCGERVVTVMASRHRTSIRRIDHTSNRLQKPTDFLTLLTDDKNPGESDSGRSVPTSSHDNTRARTEHRRHSRPAAAPLLPLHSLRCAVPTSHFCHLTPRFSLCSMYVVSHSLLTHHSPQTRTPSHKVSRQKHLLNV